MLPKHASRIAAHLRRLRRAKIIDVYDYSVADAMLWQLRRVGHGVTRASYDAIARISSVCRTKVQKSVAKLTRIGLFAKQTHRVKVHWGWNKSLTADRQGTNTYAWSTEGAGPPVLEGKEASLLTNKESVPRQEAQAALDRVRMARQTVLRRHHDPIHHPARAV